MACIEFQAEILHHVYSDHEAIEWAKQIANGLAYLHSANPLVRHASCCNQINQDESFNSASPDKAGGGIRKENPILKLHPCLGFEQEDLCGTVI